MGGSFGVCPGSVWLSLSYIGSGSNLLLNVTSVIWITTWLVFILHLFLFFTICQSFTFTVPPSSSSVLSDDILYIYIYIYIYMSSGDIVVSLAVAGSLLKE
jgi:hypothetical protein